MPPNVFGKPCPQLVVDQNGNPQAAGDEDCLFLNVFRPAQTKAADMLPVMVWFPGGCGCGEGAVMGAAPVGAALYDPARLVEKGVVVVTLNYRIGVLGRFAHP